MMSPKFYVFWEASTKHTCYDHDFQEFESREKLNEYLEGLDPHHEITYIKIVSGFTLEERGT